MARATIIRSAKYSDWCSNELMAYNIAVTAMAPEHFLPEVDPPATRGLDLELVFASLDADGVSDDTYRFLTYLHMATNAGQDTAIDDFAREVLHTVRRTRTRLAYPTRYPVGNLWR